MTKTYRVLIVDDSNLNRLALKSYFSQLGHKVVAQAGSVDEGRKMFLEHKPDLVTIDQVMPKNPGTVLAKYINTYDEEHGTKTSLFFITGDPLRDTLKEQINVDQYILKPSTKDKIEQAIANL